MKYVLKMRTDLIIYGAGYRGEVFAQKAIEAGYSVRFFLDKKASDIKERGGISVLLPSELDESTCNNVPIVITTGNPLSVANKLFNRGFNKLIFECDNCKNVELCAIGAVYEGILSGIIVDWEVPFYSIELDDRFSDGAFIRKEDANVIAYVPDDLIYIHTKEGFKNVYDGCSDLIYCVKAYDGNSPLDSVWDRLQRHDEITLSKVCLDHYFKNNKESTQAYLMSKINSYNLKLAKLENTSWFVDNPVIMHRERGLFFVLSDEDQLLQLLYLLARGFHRIPVKMSDEDYNEWINESILKKMITWSKNQDLRTSYTMLEHPNFFNFPAARDICFNSRISHIARWIHDNDLSLENKSVIDVGSYYGYYSRYFYRMGANVTSVEYDFDSYSFQVWLNELLYCVDIKTVHGGAENIDSDLSFDYCIMLTVLYWHLDTDIGLKLLHTVNSITSRYLIWESGDEAEREKEFIKDNSDFCHYHKIADTVGTGITRELGIWSK